MVSLACQKGAFELRRAAEAANHAPRANHTVIRQPGFTCGAQDVAARPRGAGPTGQQSHVAVGGDLAYGNPSDHAQDPATEEGADGQRATASVNTRPSARGRLTWLK